MAQQINLINLELRKKRDLLTAAPLSIAFGVVLAIVFAAFMVAQQRANTVQAEAGKRTAELKQAQDQMQELSKKIAETKPDPRLAEELGHARTLLNLREEIIQTLEGGVFGKGGGYSEFMRGFARQAPRDLWLTGFVLRSEDASIEIRGSMLKPAALPEFIRRLGDEVAFKGIGFASLLVGRTTQEITKEGAGQPPAAAPPPPPASSRPPSSTGAPASPAAAGAAGATKTGPPVKKEVSYATFVIRSVVKDADKLGVAPAGGSQ
ncbi:MAG: hypothetical protein KBF29_10925 [Sterolibacterium sp.]|nr:hypothetical protein [Sterolibacterium sp.]